MTLSVDNNFVLRPAEGFLVKAVLRMTPDKGIGVFADQFILSGTKVYDLEPIRYNEQETMAHLEKLSEQEKRYWLEHCCGGKNNLVLEYPFDIVLINHSNNPTISDSMENQEIGCASRDIQKGEELTEDYRIEPVVPYLEKLYEKYGIIEDYLYQD